MKSDSIVKKIILIIFKICLGIALFVCLNLLFMPKYIEENNDGRITAEFYREKTPIDVIFTGSSLIHAGISPMALYRDYGITAYDRSNSSQTIALSYYIAEETIKRNKPELIVADVGFIYEASDYVDEGASRKALDGMKWSSSKVKAINSMMDETEYFTDYMFPILRFHSRWNDLKPEDLKYLFYKPTVTANGQLIQFNIFDGGVSYNPYHLEEDRTACDENMQYLQKLSDLCKDNNVQLALIKLPSYECNWNRALDDQISDFAGRNDLYYKSFIDDFDSIGLEIPDFSDRQHMNSNGAEKFSKVLGEYLVNNYTVSDRRNDGKINAVFEEKLDRYNSLMADKTNVYK